jgi:hypothetical protein
MYIKLDMVKDEHLLTPGRKVKLNTDQECIILRVFKVTKQYTIYCILNGKIHTVYIENIIEVDGRARVRKNSMYTELENLINANQPENAGILLAAIICQDRMDDDHQVDWDRETFVEALEGDLP